MSAIKDLITELNLDENETRQQASTLEDLITELNLDENEIR